MPHVVFLRAAFVFGLAQGLVIEKDENDATAVGYAPFMQSIWTPEVLHGVLAERGPPGASLVGDAEEMENFQMNQNKYWVHDPSDTPTGPQHGWVYLDTTYAPHVHIFEQGEEAHGIECSKSETTVQVGTHHVDNRKIRSGSVLLIEGCATMGETDIRDRFVHVGQLLDQDASLTTFSAHPKSLAEIGDLVERHRVAFHVPVPGNEVVSTLEEAYAEFQSSGLRTQKNKIHRIKTSNYKPEKGDYDLNQAKADGDPWAISWRGNDTITKSYKMDGELVKAEAKIEGSYEVSASLGTAVVGECVYKNGELKGFLAYFTGNLATSASATLTATVNGKFTVPLMPKGMSVNLPIFASVIQVYVKMGWDLDLVVEITGKAEVTASAEGKGRVKMGAYHNRAVPNSAMPIHTGQFALEPKPMKAEAELAGKASLVLDVVFGAVASAWGVGSAGISLSLTIEPGVFLDIKTCPAKPTNFQQSLSLDVRCGAEVKATWSALWGLRTGEKSVYATGMKTCSVICDGPCVRTFVNIECPPDGWYEMFVAAVQSGIAAVQTLKKNFYEYAIQAFCDEVEVEKLSYDGQRATVAGTSHPALSWDGKKFSSGGKEAKKYQCTKDAIPKALSDIGNDDFVYYPMVNLVPTASSGLDVTDYYEE